MPTTATTSKKVPARALSAIVFDQLPEHDTIWAIAAGPKGEVIHIAVCCETTGGGSVQLFKYEVARKKLSHALDAASSLREFPESGHATHGKVHFALCPSSDGYVYATTHCSTPPLGDKHWDAHAMWNDPVKSFTGGHFFRYDPTKGKCDDFGILYPNMGLPLLALDDKLGRLAGVTYPRGDIFFIDKDGSNFVDAGRYSESYPLAIALDEQGYGFISDSYGCIIRLNLHDRTAETLNSRAPIARRSRMNPMCDAKLGPDGLIYGVSYSAADMFRFKPTHRGDVEIENLGPAIPGWEMSCARGLCFADDGMLYCCCFDPTAPAQEQRLIRLNPKTGEKEDLGTLFHRGVARRYWRCARGSDGKLYGGETGRRPISVIIIDPKNL